MKNFRLVVLTALFWVTANLFTSCTYSVIVTDTHGKAEDVVDQTSSVDPDVDADITANVPVKAI